MCGKITGVAEDTPRTQNNGDKLGVPPERKKGI